jgi:cysteine desulfurase / selenocysteine lyase
VISFAMALDYLEKVGLPEIKKHEQFLTEYAVKKLDEIPGIIQYGTRNFHERGGIVSFNVEGVHPHDVGSILDAEGIAVRAGHHCCEPFMRRLDISGTVRASFYLYNGPEDVDALIHGVLKVKEIFKSVVKH